MQPIMSQSSNQLEEIGYIFNADVDNLASNIEKIEFIQNNSGDNVEMGNDDKLTEIPIAVGVQQVAKTKDKATWKRAQRNVIKKVKASDKSALETTKKRRQEVKDH